MNATLTGLVLHNDQPIVVGGLTLTERGVLLLGRAGCDSLKLWGSRLLEPSAVDRLHARGVVVAQRDPASAPLSETGHAAFVIVGPNVLVEQAVVNETVRMARDGVNTAMAVFDAGVPLLLYVPHAAALHVRSCRSLDTMVATLERLGVVRELPLVGGFCRRAHRTEGRSLERAYIRHLNGGESESFFTKQIRRFSVPMSVRLVALGATPTQVTLAGFALAVASAWSIAQGNYGAGLVGGVLCYASMVFDCSDGEVARLTVRDSPSGAWLETMVDYATYFLLLGGLTVASQQRPEADAYRGAAAVALVGSLLAAAITGYLRHRVAAADPGQFDEASARVMGGATRFHRFASWSRQWIKRSSVAHLVLVLALLNQLPWLLYLWAFGATTATVVMLAVQPFVVRRVRVTHAHVPPVQSGGSQGV